MLEGQRSGSNKAYHDVTIPLTRIELSPEEPAGGKSHERVEEFVWSFGLKGRLWFHLRLGSRRNIDEGNGLGNLFLLRLKTGRARLTVTTGTL